MIHMDKLFFSKASHFAISQQIPRCPEIFIYGILISRFDHKQVTTKEHEIGLTRVLLFAFILSTLTSSCFSYVTHIAYAQESQNQSSQDSQSQQSSNDNSFPSFFNVTATDILAVIVAISSAVFSAWNGFRYSKLQKRFDAVVDFRARIRNRTYEECLPLLFEFINLAETALFKIVNIVEHAKRNELTQSGKRFSSSANKANDYFRINAFYTLLAPVAAFRIFQEKLTFYDLNLDVFIFKQYELGKQLVYCFSGDRLIKRIVEDISNNIQLTPNKDNSRYHGIIKEFAELRPSGEVYADIYKLYYQVKEYDRMNNSTRQGLRNAELIILTDFLIERDSDRGPRLKTFATFRREYLECYADTSKVEKYHFPYEQFEIINAVFDDFIPERKPLLWIILLAQALVYQVLLKNQSEWHASASDSLTFNNYDREDGGSMRKLILDEVKENLFDAIENIRDEERRGRRSKILDYSTDNANNANTFALQKSQLLIAKCFLMTRLEDIKESIL